MEAAKDPRGEGAGGRRRQGSHSGRLLLRMPESLHAELARASERAGVSLNAYIVEALGGAVGKRAAEPQRPAQPTRPATRRRAVERLLVLNLLVVGAVGILAAVLLVEALR